MASSLQDQRILLAVTGGIAAYKVASFARLLRTAGAEVRVVMSAAARKFVGPPTFEAITGNAVLTDLFAGGGGVDHVELARWPHHAVVAPATANILAKMAHGLADDPVSTVLLATRAPVMVAPAMNDGMWEHPATQANLETLRSRGVAVVGPEEGFLAEGYAAVGRMVESETLMAALEAAIGESA